MRFTKSSVSHTCVFLLLAAGCCVRTIRFRPVLLFRKESSLRLCYNWIISRAESLSYCDCLPLPSSGRDNEHGTTKTKTRDHFNGSTHSSVWFPIASKTLFFIHLFFFFFFLLVTRVVKRRRRWLRDATGKEMRPCSLEKDEKERENPFCLAAGAPSLRVVMDDGALAILK